LPRFTGRTRVPSNIGGVTGIRHEACSGGCVSQALQESVEAFRRVGGIDRRVWSEPGQSFRTGHQFTDPGERAAFDYIREESADHPILDLGVESGRTAAILRSISRDYVGLGATPELVRDLSRFADDSFQLVVFGANGIDAATPGNREAVLGEVLRVLCPGGELLFSTHNRCGAAHRKMLEGNPVKRVGRAMAALLHAGRAAYDEGAPIHHITLLGQLAQLEEVGFQPDPLVWASSDGRRLWPGDDTSDARWFHLVTRK
jgi:SAM-dependent methyltransferase